MQGRWPHPVFSSGGRGPGFPQFVPEQSMVHPHANSTIPFNPFMHNGIFPAHNAILPGGNLVDPNYGTGFQPEVHAPPREAFDRIDKVVSKCHADLLASGETVSSYKVSQAALFELQAVSWESLGFRMQQIPSLFSLMATEGKINAFIHCFLVVRGIATLHDLEVSICKNEGVEKFEQLEFGPLTRHPLVIHYFSHGSELDGVLKISSGEVISYLSEFMEIKKRKHIKADGFLNFIAKKQSVQTKDQLGVLIQNLGMYVSYVGEAKDGEDASVKKCLISHKRKSTQSGHKKRRRLFPSLKKNLDDRFKVMSDRVQSFASEHDNFCGKHIRFVSSSSNDDNSSDAYGTEDEMDVKGSNNQCSILPHTAETSEKLSACPYPSATEEMTRLKMKSGTGDASSLDSKSGHSGNRSGIGKRSRFLKRRKIEEKNLTSSYEYNFSLSESSQRIFITTWKEACRELDVSEVSQVFCKWADQLSNGFLCSKDISYLRESLTKSEFTILPTALDKWVSLNPSFGLVCWCDDGNLRKEFRYKDGIDFLYFNALNDHQGDVIRSKISTLLRAMGIPALSQIVTREAIPFGSGDPSFKASLVNWSLPYAQRYIRTVYPDKYSEFQLSEFKVLDIVQVVVVEKLFYKHVVKRCNLESNKQYKCSTILQDKLLYTTSDSDSHSLFLELSRLFFDGSPELHLSNLLHMLATMAEAGSTDEQIEFFVLNSQKLPKLPENEPSWSLPGLPSRSRERHPTQSQSIIRPPKPIEKLEAGSCFPPVGSGTAPSFLSAPKPPSVVIEEKRMEPISPHKADQNDTAEAENVPLPGEIAEVRKFNMAYEPVIVSPVSDPTEARRFRFDETNPLAVQAMQTGKIGEFIAFHYLVGLLGEANVRWVNRDQETGLPYDIIVGDGEASVEYVEVKATRSARKDWFGITPREWQFALERGDDFSVAHINLSQNDAARVTIFKNPAKLCQQGNLQLVLMMQRQHREYSGNAPRRL